MHLPPPAFRREGALIDMASSSVQTQSAAVSSERFRTSRATLWTDRFMTHFIKFGGIGVILAVLGIFLFIFLQILPLFRAAKVEHIKSLSLKEARYAQFGVDEWGELPFFIHPEGRIDFLSIPTGRMVKQVPLEMPEGREITAIRYRMKTQSLFIGTADGFFIPVKIQYRPSFKNDRREIKADVETGTPIEIFAGEPVLDLDYGDAGDRKLIAAIQQSGEDYALRAVRLKQKRSLLGSGEIQVDKIYNVSGQLESRPLRVLVNSSADTILVSTESGQVYFFVVTHEGIFLRQTFSPFKDKPDPDIASMDPVFGDVTVIFTHPDGTMRAFSLFIPEGAVERYFGQTKQFSRLPEGASFYQHSTRNKAFLTGSGSLASLRYLTTRTVRWEKDLPYEIQAAAIGGKYDRLYFLDRMGTFHIYRLEDAHPEAGLRAFFGKIWYEGYPKPDYVWQSTGGTDEFEPKLSLVPLILGTLKGTFYALFFALPIALLAAVYTSQFAQPRFKQVIKPMMEIMASLPSVVLGFLAALWLAPVLEDRVPSLLVITLLVPAAALIIGYAWNLLPQEYRHWMKPGYEWIVFIPVLLFVGWLGWEGGVWLERIAFVVENPNTGMRVADFRLWWQTVVGADYEQRNSLVVGFIMGFAVIPIIFTIAEDSLSNVPKTLSAASLALGASRWQTTFRVILPTAFPGIFSAAMIGFGRAVGETMIVVMATGNTPIMDFNIFSGFRTLSANIAVELPEAPYLGTLYRSLFLGALALFMMTFFVNTGAEIIRQYLREKYKMV